jgi:hypothetical protein
MRAVVALIALILPASAQKQLPADAQVLAEMATYITQWGWNCAKAVSIMATTPDHYGEVAKVTCEVTSSAGGGSARVDYRVSIPHSALNPGNVRPWR